MSIAVPLYGFGGSGGGTGGKLIVTAPAGATVTVSKDGKTKTKVASAEGVAVFQGLTTGEWTVTMTDGEQTSQPQIVTVTVDYTAELTFFSATINVTYPEGSVCTATDGVTTLAASDTSGTWACVVPNAGTWTVTATNGTDTKSASVSITTDGQSESVTITYALYLYDMGNEFSSVTGEYSQQASNHRSGWASKGSDNLYAEETNSTGWSVSRNGYTTNNKIDLTKYNRIVFRINTVGYTDGALSAGSTVMIMNQKEPSSSVTTFEKNVTEEATDTLDISALSGSYYIFFGVYSWIGADSGSCKGAMNFYSAYLE